MITEEQKHQCKYFIKKFEAIPEEKWCTGTFKNGKGQRCALGQSLGDKAWNQRGPETEHLMKLFPCAQDIVDINDGVDSRYSQPHPKQRILAALHDRLKQ